MTFAHEFGHALGLSDVPGDVGDLMDHSLNNTFQLTAFNIVGIINNTSLNSVAGTINSLYTPGYINDVSQYGNYGNTTYKSVGEALIQEIDGTGTGQHLFSDGSIRSNGSPSVYDIYQGYDPDAINTSDAFFNGEGLGDGVTSYTRVDGWWGTGPGPGYHNHGVPEISNPSHGAVG